MIDRKYRHRGNSPGHLTNHRIGRNCPLLGMDWSIFEPWLRYLSAISHQTPTGLYGLTIPRIDSP